MNPEEEKRQISRFRGDGCGGIWYNVKRAKYLTKAGFLGRFLQLRELDKILEDNGFKRFKRDFLFGKIKDILYRIFVDPEAIYIQTFRDRLQSQGYSGEKETCITIEPAYLPFDPPKGLEIRVSEGNLFYLPQDYNALVEEEFSGACTLIRGYVLSRKRNGKRSGWAFEGPGVFAEEMRLAKLAKHMDRECE